MVSKFTLLLILPLLILPLSLHAAPSSNQEQEYQQVRKIALRDPKVRAAYEEADLKLEAKIIQIDPALASYVHHRTPESPSPTAAKATPQLKPASKPVAHDDHQRAHVVVKGDTLGSIAVKYGVTVAALKGANNIQDERKLAVGQVLSIPGGKAPSKKAGAWDHIKNVF